MMTMTNNSRKALAILAAVLMALSILIAASGEAEARTRVPTKTFSNPSLIRIPDSSQANPSEIKVGGFKRGSIRDVNLKLKGYSHTFSADVDVLLVGPKGQNAIVMSDVGNGTAVGGADLNLDDEAASPLPRGDQLLSSGSYQPADYENYDHNGDPLPGGDAFLSPAPTTSGNSGLSVFDGTRPNGTWRLFVVDDVAGEFGEFAGGWSLEIKARVGR